MMKRKKIRSFSILSIFIAMLLVMPLVTSIQSPDVITKEALEINNDNALLRGELSSLGGDDYSTVYFQYRKGNIEDWKETEKLNKSAEDIFQERIYNLETNTYYEFRAIANNSKDSEYGAIRSFETNKSQNIFKINTESNFTIALLILLFIASILLIIIQFETISSIILLVLGFIVLYNDISIILGVIIILLSVFVAFLNSQKGGNN